MQMPTHPAYEFYRDGLEQIIDMRAKELARQDEMRKKMGIPAGGMPMGGHSGGGQNNHPHHKQGEPLIPDGHKHKEEE
jgi:hypothetical protein